MLFTVLNELQLSVYDRIIIKVNRNSGSGTVEYIIELKINDDNETAN